MKFLAVDPFHSRPIYEVEVPSHRDVLAALGVNPDQTDHGLLRRATGGAHGLSIVVYEFGLFEHDGQRWFSLGGRLYAGKAVIYAFDQAGETAPVDANAEHWIRRLLDPLFFDSIGQVESAIERSIVLRPAMSGPNAARVWQWPDPAPTLFRAEMAKNRESPRRGE